MFEATVPLLRSVPLLVLSDIAVRLKVIKIDFFINNKNLANPLLKFSKIINVYLDHIGYAYNKYYYVYISISERYINNAYNYIIVLSLSRYIYS